MTDFNRKESAEWAMVVNAETDKLIGGVTKALADGARRGFPAPPGDTLTAILDAGQDTKAKLAEMNGKIYEEQRALIFQKVEFAMNVVVKLAKLTMEAYREELMNALAIEQSEVEALRDQGRADVERLNAQTDLRQAAIIQGRAEMERRITGYKAQLVAAETETLPLERALVQAQLATAEKKLEIISSIYQVLKAEKLVLAAENHRAEVLGRVLVAKQAVAAIKREMVPFYLEKAEATQDLAEATQSETQVREQLETLGYDRLELKVAQEDMEHQERLANEELEICRLAQARAESAIQIAREKSRRLLLEHSNAVMWGPPGNYQGPDGIIEPKPEDITSPGVMFLKQKAEKTRIWNSVLRDANDSAVKATYQGMLIDNETNNLDLELDNILQNMIEQATSREDTVRDGATTQTEMSILSADIKRRIIAG